MEKTEQPLTPFQLRLRSLRKARSLTQQQLADLCGLSKSYLWVLETKEPLPNARPGAALIDRLAAGLGVTSVYLLHGDEGGAAEEGERLLATFNSLPPSEKQVVTRLAEALAVAGGRT